MPRFEEWECSLTELDTEYFNKVIHLTNVQTGHSQYMVFEGAGSWEAVTSA